MYERALFFRPGGSMKEYYKILDLSPNASEDDIRKAYRRLALRYHPDRNPGDSAAEERFKEIAEAYGVLMDPAKRASYDGLRATGGRQQAGGGFGYSQEEILRDLFRDPRFHQVFQEVFEEFQQAGFRFDQRFFDKAFFGGRGISGGIFVWGPFGGRPVRAGVRPRPQPEIARQPDEASRQQPAGFLQRLGRKISTFLQGERKASPAGSLPDLDLDFELSMPSAAAREGTWVQIAVPRDAGQEKIRVRIPSHTRSGTRLRLRGKGRQRHAAAGDLYLTIHLT
jgi:curved DNA-binding protein